MTREMWKQWYRVIRIMRREQAKAWRDMMIFGTGAVMIPNDGSDPHYVPLTDIRADDDEPRKPGFTGDEEDDHYADDPRRGQARGLNRKYG